MLKYRNYMMLSWILILFVAGCSSIDKAESLFKQGDKEAALEMAISLLDDDDAKIRLRSVKLIGKIG
ncbi:MAG: HEAT repeat domain-containing protein, partial [SAR324 cluster bacterium]|nr:HEAT repeat domain-containing protein [SAR324 cluster bacterium]